MRGGLTAAVRILGPLQAAVDGRLDVRLDRGRAAPVALGLSGGGDSLALLHLAAAWCARAGRPLLALTVDHGLSPESAGWTARAGRMAAEAGVGWRALAWTGPKPSTGLPAAARAARHALLADAAREAGACVVLLAHTADDHAETEALRRGAAPGIGRLREWSPSPAWPEGRGVFLLRPLLGASRVELRAWLGARALAWLEDPANADPRFARVRLRRAGVAPAPPEGAAHPGFGHAREDGRVLLPRARLAADEAGARRSLAAAIACAAGAKAAPRGAALDRLLARLAAVGDVVATLGGARIGASADMVAVGRDLGRTPPPDAPLAPAAPAVWDGRFEATTVEPGWRVGAAAGRLSRVPAAERAGLPPPPFRSAHPVFVRGREVRLQPSGVALRGLVAARFDAALGRIAGEPRLRAREAQNQPFFLNHHSGSSVESTISAQAYG